MVVFLEDQEGELATNQKMWGVLLRRQRRKKKISLEDLADQLKISLTDLQSIEDGEKAASKEMIEEIARILDVNREKLAQVVNQSLTMSVDELREKIRSI